MTLSHEALTFVRPLAALFAVPAAHGEWKRSQASFGDLVSAIETVAIMAFLEAT